MKKFIEILKDFKRMSFSRHLNWKKNYKLFYLIPTICFEWDSQCFPIVEEGKIVFPGYRELTISIEWLNFYCAMIFEFDWSVNNIEEFKN